MSTPVHPAAHAPSPVMDPHIAPPFPEAAFTILKNTQLRKNVAHATDVIQAKRNNLVAEKADWQELRTSAAAIRAHVLANLDTYLRAVRNRLHRRGWNRPLGSRRGRSTRNHLEYSARRECDRGHQDQDHDLR